MSNPQTTTDEEIIERIKKVLEFGRDSFPRDSAGEVFYLNALTDLDILKRRIEK